MRILFTFIFLAGFFYTNAQDLIITNTRDSIECRIHQVRAEQIIYVENINGRFDGKMIELTEVAAYFYNFRNTNIENEDTIETVKSEINEDIKVYNFPGVHFAIGGGFSYQLGKISREVPHGIRPHLTKLKSGYHLNSEVAFFAHRTTGFGAKVSFFKSKNQEYVSNVTIDNGQRVSGNISDDLTIMFIGPTICFRSINEMNKENYALFEISVGYMNYKNRVNYFNAPFRISGNNVGISTGISYNVELKDGVGLMFKFSTFAGSLKYADINGMGVNERIELDDNARESMSRIDFGIGLNFR